MQGRALASHNLNADPFGVLNPAAGTPSMPFRSANATRERGVPVSPSIAPAVADTAPSMPHGSQASHTARSPTRKRDPLAFLDDMKKMTDKDDNTGH